MSDSANGVEYRFYTYNDDSDDPRFAFYMTTGDGGEFPLYDRPPEGEGMWHHPECKSEYGAVAPSDEFRRVIAGVFNGGVDGDKVAALDAHEEHFFRVIHGTADMNPDNIPDPVWSFIHQCGEAATNE